MYIHTKYPIQQNNQKIFSDKTFNLTIMFLEEMYDLLQVHKLSLFIKNTLYDTAHYFIYNPYNIGNTIYAVPSNKYVSPHSLQTVVWDICLPWLENNLRYPMYNRVFLHGA